MPELPEVETIKNGLSERIVGSTIRDVLIYNRKSFQGDKHEVLNTRVLSLERRAKTICIRLSNGENLLFHLKMTGQLVYIDSHDKRISGGHPSEDLYGELPNTHTRIEFVFEDSSHLFFNDLRKFGWCKVLDNDNLSRIFKDFGPEPFSKAFNVEYLIDKANRFPNRTIKQFLMDQTIVAGIGNIYDDEALFLAKINPKTKVSLLNRGDWGEIYRNVILILEKGIEYGGTTDSDYVDVNGEKGNMQEHLNVYHKEGMPCPNHCGENIVKTKLGGRGTYFCPNCQKEPA